MKTKIGLMKAASDEIADVQNEVDAGQVHTILTSKTKCETWRMRYNFQKILCGSRSYKIVSHRNFL